MEKLPTAYHGDATGNVPHDQLCGIAKHFLRAQSHKLRDHVSIHTLPPTVAFASAQNFLENVTRVQGVKPQQVFLGTVGADLTLTVALDYVPSSAPASGKKRGRHDAAHDHAVQLKKDVDAALAKVANAVSDPPTVDHANKVLMLLGTQLKGPNAEQLVESWALSTRPKSLGNGQSANVGSDPRRTVAPAKPANVLVLSARFAGGVPIPLSALRRAFGTSFYDGMLASSAHNNATPNAFELPPTEQGRVGEREGQACVLLHAALAPAAP